MSQVLLLAIGATVSTSIRITLELSGGQKAKPFGRPLERRVRRHSNEFPKFFGGESCVLDNTAHSECIHWIRARYREDALAVSHDNVLAFSNHAKASLFECANGTRVRYARYLGQLNRDLDLPNVRTLC
jgi:hypothetical protein